MKPLIDFPWPFHINRFYMNLLQKSEFERTIIETQYQECCQKFSKETIDNLLLTCNHGVIVIDKDNKLKGFCLSIFIEDESKFITKIICGDHDIILKIMECLKTVTKYKLVDIWDILIEPTVEKIQTFKGYGFEITDENSGTMIMTQKFKKIRNYFITKMTIEFNKPIFFVRDDPYSDLFCEMIHAQHIQCCNKKIDEGYISNCFNDFTNGYMILDEPIPDDKNYRGHHFFLRAFVLFEYRKERIGFENNIERVIRGKVICSSPVNKGLGRILLDKVKEFAVVHNVKRWIINSLAKDTLIAYYERYGFTQRKLNMFSTGKLKTVLMSMHLGYGIDLYDYSKDDGTCFEYPYLTEDSIPSDEEFESKFTDLLGDGI